MLQAGEAVKPPLRSASAAFHVVKGRGDRVNAERIEWGPKDSFTAPVFSKIDQYAEEEIPCAEP